MRYCIGDLHGCIKTFKALFEQILVKDNSPNLFLVGDLIDRGPDSKTLIDYITDMKAQGFISGIVRGNHEQMLIDAYSKNLKLIHSDWYQNGAEKTILSFNKNIDQNASIKEQVPEKYYKFLNSLPYYIELDDFYIVHAGFNFVTNKPFDDTEAMLWTREETNLHNYTKGKKIIHGHTPVPFEKIKLKTKHNDCINIDSGCVYTNKPGLGTLTALNMDTFELINIKNRDIKPID